MKKNTSAIIAVIACVLVAICLFQISGLKQQLQNLDNNMNNRFSGVERMEHIVNNIYANIDNRLSEQADLLASSGWKPSEVDIVAKTATIQCAVAPKEYRPDSTAAILICNDVQYPMTLQNGEYIVSLPLPLFENSAVSKVLFVDDGMVRTQSLDWDIYPRYNFLPDVTVQFMGEGSGKVKDGMFVWKMKGDAEIHVTQKGKIAAVQSISLITYIAGGETARTDIPLNTKPSARGNTMLAERAEYEVVTPSDFYYPMDTSFEVPFNSTLELIVEVVDSYGLHYRGTLYHIDVDGSGRPQDTGWWNGAESSIYDENGTVLWDPNA